LAPLADPARFEQFLAEQYREEWVVHIEPPTGDPERVLKYLARYTYRVAIANERIESIENGQVSFRYKDYAQGGRWRLMTLSAHEFLQRFVWHVLPKGWVRVRAFGFLAGWCRTALLARCRELLSASAHPARSTEAAETEVAGEGRRCARCGRGIWRMVAELPRPRVSEMVDRTYRAPWNNSS
jgi:hypothetical protein